jgi:hypothetical protein
MLQKIMNLVQFTNYYLPFTIEDSRLRNLKSTVNSNRFLNVKLKHTGLLRPSQ